MKIKKVYLGRKQIRPDDGWKPGENTLGYYEFTNNLNDSSGKGNNLSQAHSGYTYNTTGDITYLTNTSGRISRSISGVDLNNMTVSCWLRKTSSSTVSVVWSYGMSSGTRGYGTGILINSSNKVVIFVYMSDITSTLTASYNNWHHIVLTNNNGTSTVYLDGTNKRTTTKTFTKENTLFSLLANPDTNGDPHKGDIDSVILESKVRTDQEVLDYYNSTKSLYGIS